MIFVRYEANKYVAGVNTLRAVINTFEFENQRPGQ